MNNRTVTSLRSQLGFTIQEIIIAIIIVGVLAGLSYPSFVNSIERVRSQEAEKILIIIYGAQKEYAYNNSGNYTNNTNNFDVTFPAPKGYNAPLANNGTTDITCHGSNGVTMIGSITKPNPNGYTLYIREADAIIMCCPTSATDTICTKIGKTVTWP